MKRIPALIFILLILIGSSVVGGLVIYKKTGLLNKRANLPENTRLSKLALPEMETPEQVLNKNVSNKLKEKLNKEVGNVIVLQNTGTFAKGSYEIKDGDKADQFIFIAQKEGDAWNIIFNGKDDAMSCNNISKEVPVGLVPNCLNNEGTLIGRF